LTRRILAFILCLTLLWAAACRPADVAALDTALSRWLDGGDAVVFSASMQIVTLMPFDEATIALLNGVLKHVTVDASIASSGEDGATDARIAVDGSAVMDWTETAGAARVSFHSLLPNRVRTRRSNRPWMCDRAGNAARKKRMRPDTEATADTVIGGYAAMRKP
jgi:hypothetical protein